jgi:hypothetical protein
MKGATQKQKTFFKKVVENTTLGNPKPLGALALESGYGKISKQPCRIMNSQGFQSLLAQIDDDIVLKKVVEILGGDDKRASLSAADMLLKLKNRYPDQATKAVGLFGVISGLKKVEGEEELI